VTFCCRTLPSSKFQPSPEPSSIQPDGQLFIFGSPPSPSLLVPNFQRLFFLFFFLSFVCLFLFRGGVREGVGEEEEEKKKGGGDGDMVMRTSWSSR